MKYLIGDDVVIKEEAVVQKEYRGEVCRVIGMNLALKKEGFTVVTLTVIAEDGKQIRVTEDEVEEY